MESAESDGVTISDDGTRAHIVPLGAAVVTLAVRGRDARAVDVAMPAGGSAGKIVGRYANRIARGRFALDGREYVLATNDDGNTLHGGPDGFSKRRWSLETATPASVAWSLVSPDGDQGFPGRLTARVTYTLAGGALRIDYEATTDAPTVVNLTNHLYFNLSGDPARSIADHVLHVAASRYVAVDAQLIPTGLLAPVAGTALDFRAPHPLGDAHLDSTLVFDEADGALRPVARLAHPESGRSVTVESTQPGMQLFTGKPGAVALETQHFPDAPNRPNFPATTLRPDETFRATTVYRFEVETGSSTRAV